MYPVEIAFLKICNTGLPFILAIPDSYPARFSGQIHSKHNKFGIRNKVVLLRNIELNDRRQLFHWQLIWGSSYLNFMFPFQNFLAKDGNSK